MTTPGPGRCGATTRSCPACTWKSIGICLIFPTKPMRRQCLQVCRGHRKTDLLDEAGYPPQFEVEPGKTVRPGPIWRPCSAWRTSWTLPPSATSAFCMTWKGCPAPGTAGNSASICYPPGGAGGRNGWWSTPGRRTRRSGPGWREGDRQAAGKLLLCAGWRRSALPLSSPRPTWCCTWMKPEEDAT